MVPFLPYGIITAYEAKWQVTISGTNTRARIPFAKDGSRSLAMKNRQSLGQDDWHVAAGILEEFFTRDSGAGAQHDALHHVDQSPPAYLRGNPGR